MRQEKMADDGELCPVLGLTKPDCDCNPATAGEVSAVPVNKIDRYGYT